MSAADGMLSAPIAASCAWTALLAGAERARDGGVDDRVLEQVLGQLADRVLARACKLVAEAVAVGHRNLAFHGWLRLD